MRQFLCFGANEIASTFSFIQTKIFLNPVLRCCLKSTYATRPLIGRSHPNSPCTILLAENEWKILYLKIYPQKPLPIEIPTVQEAVRWIAQLGGFLGRKRDGEPGPIALWRGWMRFCDLAEGWNLAIMSASCG